MAPEPAGLHPALHTELCARVGVRYPVVQTGMGWVAGPRLVAATTEAGGLGILASATMSLDELAAAIAEVRRRTSGPFGVNLRTDVADVHERIELMIETGARVASFAQAPNPALVTRCKEAGLFVMPTVGARRHAEKVAEWGVDAVIAQGGEGGGHTGTVPTTLLLPQVVEAVGDRVLVLGAGGFHSGRGLVAALAYGAAGIAMGTRSPRPRAVSPTPSRPSTSARPSRAPWSRPRSTVRPSASRAPNWWTTWSRSRGCARCRGPCAAPIASVRKRAPPSRHCSVRAAP